MLRCDGQPFDWIGLAIFLGLMLFALAGAL